uniref:Uncharacterized protein n=1 Tax=Hyaloperonospora arabidopsidis (strain Emoy2) TaxID=559515 RepID=M4BAG1_HYAAE
MVHRLDEIAYKLYKLWSDPNKEGVPHDDLDKSARDLFVELTTPRRSREHGDEELESVSGRNGKRQKTTA